MNRKDKILEQINQSEKPISASYLANLLGVSRQIIVGDIALLRASGCDIIATPRGYVIDKLGKGVKHTIAVKHQSDDLKDELYTIVDMGGSIEDVIVEHPVYGQLTGKLHISSRYDVDQFLIKIENSHAKPLSQLTDGLHLHTITCENMDAYHRIIKALDEKGYLLS